MRSSTRGLLAVVVTCWLGTAAPVHAHGSPTQWSAESTEYGCWIMRWLGVGAKSETGEEMVALQAVIGRILPPRTDLEQPAITPAELAGSLTLNIRIVDPSIGDIASVGVAGAKSLDSIQLQKRSAAGLPEDFSSFFVTGPDADSILTALRSGQASAIVLHRGDGTEIRSSITDTGLRVAIAMFDACVATTVQSKT